MHIYPSNLSWAQIPVLVLSHQLLLLTPPILLHNFHKTHKTHKNPIGHPAQSKEAIIFSFFSSSSYSNESSPAFHACKKLPPWYGSTHTPSPSSCANTTWPGQGLEECDPKDFLGLPHQQTNTLPLLKK